MDTVDSRLGKEVWKQTGLIKYIQGESALV